MSDFSYAKAGVAVREGVVAVLNWTGRLEIANCGMRALQEIISGGRPLRVVGLALCGLSMDEVVVSRSLLP